MKRNFTTLEAGATYVATNGKHIFIVGKNQGGDGFVGQEPSGELDFWLPNGTAIFDGKTPRDLIRKIEPKREIWLNMWEGGGCTPYADQVLADIDADQLKQRPRLARKRIEWAPGEFDE